MPVAIREQWEKFRKDYSEAESEQSFFAGALTAICLLCTGTDLRKLAEEIIAETQPYSDKEKECLKQGELQKRLSKRNRKE